MEKSYNCIMIGYKPINIINTIQENIDENDLLPGKGLETESHITLLYGLYNNVSWDDVKSYLMPLSDYKTFVYNVSVFNNEEFDVLKMDINCDNLKKTNKLLRDNLPHDEFYPDYHPHMTIAYLKPNCGAKYAKKMLDKIITIEPIEYIFSYGNDGKYTSEKHSSIE